MAEHHFEIRPIFIVLNLIFFFKFNKCMFESEKHKEGVVIYSVASSGTRQAINKLNFLTLPLSRSQSSAVATDKLESFIVYESTYCPWGFVRGEMPGCIW